MAIVPDPTPAELEHWPLPLVLDQVLGRAGLRLVAMHDRDPGDAAGHRGLGAGGDTAAMAARPEQLCAAVLAAWHDR